MTIVGVVSDTRNAGLHQPLAPTVYLPFGQFSLPFMSVFVRSPAGLAEVVSAIHASARAVDPAVVVAEVMTLDDLVERSTAGPRFRSILAVVFAAFSLLLSGLGLYGLIAFAVSQRSREIAVRAALGASPGMLVRHFMIEGLTVAIMGIAGGVAAALAATRVLKTMLFGIGASDPVALAGAAAVFLLIAALACYLPARRASVLDPMTVLRSE